MLPTSKIFLKNPVTNKFLLVLRDNKKEIPYPNHWSILGGGIEKLESPKQALQRELLEEINIIPNKISFIKKIQITAEFNSQKLPMTLFVFKSDINLDIKNINLNEGQRLKYFSLDEILKSNNMVPWIKEFIKGNRDLLR